MYDKTGEYGMGLNFDHPEKVRETRCVLYNDIAESVEPYGNLDLTAEQVFKRLALLIDPTCYNTQTYKEAYFTCSECGATTLLLDDQNESIVDDGAFRFCPNCGARVVDGNCRDGR
jgi:DNA-directed RNA polymerase subunit RPC12/RpoP